MHGNFKYVRVIAKRILRDFWEKHKDCEEQLKSWYRETEKSEWNKINDLKKEYPVRVSKKTIELYTISKVIDTD